MSASDGSGNITGLKVENDGTGILEEDGDYDTTRVIRLGDCSDEDLDLILRAECFVPADVKEYCKERLAIDQD